MQTERTRDRNVIAPARRPTATETRRRRVLQKFFTHRPVSTFDRVPFQLTDELFLYGRPGRMDEAGRRRPRKRARRRTRRRAPHRPHTETMSTLTISANARALGAVKVRAADASRVLRAPSATANPPSLRRASEKMPSPRPSIRATRRRDATAPRTRSRRDRVAAARESTSRRRRVASRALRRLASRRARVGPERRVAGRSGLRSIALYPPIDSTRFESRLPSPRSRSPRSSPPRAGARRPLRAQVRGRDRAKRARRPRQRRPQREDPQAHGARDPSSLEAFWSSFAFRPL